MKLKISTFENFARKHGYENGAELLNAMGSSERAQEAIWSPSSLTVTERKRFPLQTSETIPRAVLRASMCRQGTSCIERGKGIERYKKIERAECGNTSNVVECRRYQRLLSVYGTESAYISTRRMSNCHTAPESIGVLFVRRVEQ